MRFLANSLPKKSRANLQLSSLLLYLDCLRSLRQSERKFPIHRVGKYLAVLSLYFVRYARYPASTHEGSYLRMRVVFVLFFGRLYRVVHNRKPYFLVFTRKKVWRNIPNTELRNLVFQELWETGV